MVAIWWLRPATAATLTVAEVKYNSAGVYMVAIWWLRPAIASTLTVAEEEEYWEGNL